MNAQDKIPEAPIDFNAEAELLGCLLLHNDTIDRVYGLEPHHFGEPVHGHIFDLIRQDTSAGKTASAVTLKARIAPKLGEDMDPVDYLSGLAGAATTPLNLKDYADHIKTLHFRREVMRIGWEAINASTDLEHDPSELQQDLETSLMGLGDSQDAKGAVWALDAADGFMANVDAAAAGEGGVTTGLPDLDRVFGKLKRQHLHILGGRPGMGKTALGISIAQNAAMAGHGVLYHSLEMPASDLYARMAARKAHLEYHATLTGKLDDWQREELRKVRLDLPMLIDDRGGVSSAQVSMAVRRAQRRMAARDRKLDLIVVDHLGLMSPTDRNAPRHLQLGRSTKDLLNIAKEMDVAVLCLCQLNRALEGRDDKRPSLADLRESGQIEEDASVVAFIHREHYYLQNAKCKDGDADHIHRLQESERIAEVLVRKNRNGPCANVKLYCDMPKNHFAGMQ